MNPEGLTKELMQSNSTLLEVPDEEEERSGSRQR